MILIVDDEPGIRDTLRRFLLRRGFDVATASNPSEAVAMLRQARPLVMILDVRMPDPTGRMRSGLDLLQFVRSRPEFDGVRVLALTGHLLSNEEEAALRAHQAELLYKPLELHRLADRLTQVGPRDARAAEVGD